MVWRQAWAHAKSFRKKKNKIKAVGGGEGHIPLLIKPEPKP